jgi:predicted metal-dependent hydrolase
MNFVEAFILFVIIVIIVMYVQNSVDIEVEYVKSSIDGRKYLVRSLKDKQKAADYLAKLNRDLMALIKHLYSKYPNKIEIQDLYKNYDPEAMSEGTHESGYTSFSVNKGSKLVVCVRHTDFSFVDYNIVLYVTIHELGHMATKEIGHTETFWNNFKFLLKEAVAIGLYKKIDFNNDPKDYCGIKIRSSVI